MTVQIRSASELDLASESMNEDIAKITDMQYQHSEVAPDIVGLMGEQAAEVEVIPTPIRNGPKVGRNDPCPCGSGKKYKNCHGSLG